MLKPEDRLGPYTLIRRLGTGSFGEVWLGEKRTVLASTPFALKIPLDPETDSDLIRREARVWLQASGHPNVLPLIEADIYDGMMVIVSEYVTGGSLDDAMSRHGGKAPDLPTAVRWMLGILDGLRHLHELPEPLIHRDLKPANILMQGGVPRITDFGLARVLQANPSQSMTVTGTLQYMSPEVFQGKRTAHTDLWAAGVIFHQLLSGSLPFPEQDMPSLIQAIMNLPPAPLPPEIPGELRLVVKRMLERDMGKRFASARRAFRALAELDHQGAYLSGKSSMEDTAEMRAVPAGPVTLPEAAPVSPGKMPEKTVVLPGTAPVPDGLRPARGNEGTVVLPVDPAAGRPPVAPRAGLLLDGAALSSVQALRATRHPKTEPVPVRPPARKGFRIGLLLALLLLAGVGFALWRGGVFAPNRPPAPAGKNVALPSPSPEAVPVGTPTAGSAAAVVSRDPAVTGSGTGSATAVVPRNPAATVSGGAGTAGPAPSPGAGQWKLPGADQGPPSAPVQSPPQSPSPGPPPDRAQGQPTPPAPEGAMKTGVVVIAGTVADFDKIERMQMDMRSTPGCTDSQVGKWTDARQGDLTSFQYEIRCSIQCPESQWAALVRRLAQVAARHGSRDITIRREP